MADHGAEALRLRLADMREEAKILRKNGATFSVERVEDFAKSIEEAAEYLLRFIPETEARLRGASKAFLRRHFATWELEGYARRAGPTREYCVLVLPRRTPASIAREAGRQGDAPAGAERRQA